MVDNNGAVVQGAETVEPSKIVLIPGGAGASIALFPDGRAFYSPDGFNLAGGGSSTLAYGGTLNIVDIVALSAGVDALFSNGTVYFSPDGNNLGGGGSTQRAYTGAEGVASLIPVAGGVDAIFAGNSSVYFSPDGLNLGGGGSTVRIYSGTGEILQIVPVGTGAAVVTLFKGGSAFYSPDNRNIGGGGSTVAAAPSTATVTTLVQVGGGVLAEFAGGAVYLSPDGQNLAGGSGSIASPAWDTSIADGPFAGRDSAQGIEFDGHLWLSGGFDDPTGSDSCFTTCSFFDLWAATDLTGTAWGNTPSFATATTPNPRDTQSIVNGGVQDAPLPTDFYDSYSAIVAWNGRLFAIGSTVWSSADGSHWSRQNLGDGVTAAPGPVASIATENSRALQLGTTLFFLQPDRGEVYSTTDPAAATWTDLGTIPGYPPRCGAAAFVFQGKLWIEGGGACDYSKTYNDVWSSLDGVNWTLAAAPAEWSARMWPCIAPATDGVVWLVGGYAPNYWNNTGGKLAVKFGDNHSDVWYSKNGASWKQFKADYGSGLPDGNSLEPRHAATCYVGQGSTANSKSLIVIAGSAGSIPDSNTEHVSNTIRSLALPATAVLP